MVATGRLTVQNPAYRPALFRFKSFCSKLDMIFGWEVSETARNRLLETESVMCGLRLFLLERATCCGLHHDGEDERDEGKGLSIIKMHGFDFCDLLEVCGHQVVILTRLSGRNMMHGKIVQGSRDSQLV